MRRSLGAVLWSLVGLLSCFLGALSALLGTRPGRSLITRALAGTLDQVVAGRIEVADVSGTLFTGLTLRDVRLYDHDSTIVAWLPEAELSYNPFDFAAGRAVMQEVKLRRPRFNLVQHPNGRLNLEELLRLGVPDTTSGPKAPKGPAPLILLRNVEISDGSLVMRLQDDPSPGDSLLEIDEFGADGRRRVRRFDDLQVNLAALRISAPRQPGIHVELNHLAVNISDPAVSIRNGTGTVTIVGDSIALDLQRLGLPMSQLAVTGNVTWPRDTLLYDLDVVADSANLADLSWIDPRFTEAARVRGAAAVNSSSGGRLVVRLDPIEIRHHGGRLAGKLTTVSVGDSGVVRIRDGDLEAENVDLELIRPLLDTLPFAGRLTGHTVVDGPIDSLALAIDWWFRDSLVAGWPETRLAGRGVVDLTNVDGLAFRPFALDTARLDLGSLERLIPALTIRGTLDGVGTLEGPYTNARWSGTLRHHDGLAPASLVRGTFRFDARRDTLGVSVDVTADTLALAGLHSSFPGLTLRVPLAGPIRMEGTLAEAATHADLQSLSGTGRVRVDGLFTLLMPPLGARDLTLTATDLDLQDWLGADAPPSRLTFTASGDVRADSGAAPSGTLQGTLSPSWLAGSAIDSGAVAVRFSDGLLHFDSLTLQQPGLGARGRGSMGWSAPQSGRLAITLNADSLDALDPLMSWVVGAERTEGDSLPSLEGAADVRAELIGSLDSLRVDARADLRAVRWREWAVPAATSRVRWEAGSGRLDIEVSGDSVAFGRLGFGGVAGRVTGRGDSLSWFARSRVGDWLAVLASGSLNRARAVTAMHIDSAAVLLPGEVWLLREPADVRVTGSSIVLADSGLSWLQGSGDGTGSVRISGQLSSDSAGAARVSVRGFPLAAVAALGLNDTTGIRGRLEADVALGGTRRAPTMQASFTAAGEPGSGAPFLARGSAGYRDRRLDSRLEVAKGERRILDLTAHLPLDLALESVSRRQLGDTLWVRAFADSVELSQLGLLDAFSSGVTGRVSTDLVVRGSWEAPRLAGHASVTDAAATIRSLNVRYEDVDGRFSFAGDTIRVDSLHVKSGSGSLSVGGYVRLDRLTQPVLALDLRARDFRALEIRNYLSVTATGDVALRGPVFGATLTGRGTVGSGELYFADLVTKRVVNLDEPWVTTLITPEELRKQAIDRGFHNRFLDSLHIRHLTLAMGSDVWLRSTEANIQLQGVVDVSKDADAYVLTGTLQAPRGTYRLVLGRVISREFVVTEGTVRYFGTTDLNAELNITAKYTVRPVRTERSGNPQPIPVTAHIGGTLFVPRLRLSATDPLGGQTLAQTEIMSYLLFGRPSFELGQTRAGSADAIALGVGFVSGELERTLVSDLGVPLDYIEIRPGDPNSLLRGAVLAAGWQIGERTFLTLNAGLSGCPDRTQTLTTTLSSATLGATLAFRISPEWRTEVSVEPVRTCSSTQQTASNVGRQYGFDLLWERRY